MRRDSKKIAIYFWEKVLEKMEKLKSTVNSGPSYETKLYCVQLNEWKIEYSEKEPHKTSHKNCSITVKYQWIRRTQKAPLKELTLTIFPLNGQGIRKIKLLNKLNKSFFLYRKLTILYALIKYISKTLCCWEMLIPVYPIAYSIKN